MYTYLRPTTPYIKHKGVLCILHGIRLGWVQDILHQQSVYANVMADLMIFYFMKLHFLLNAIENYGVR